jgi:hypothetical protein
MTSYRVYYVKKNLFFNKHSILTNPGLVNRNLAQILDIIEHSKSVLETQNDAMR